MKGAEYISQNTSNEQIPRYRGRWISEKDFTIQDRFGAISALTGGTPWKAVLIGEDGKCMLHLNAAPHILYGKSCLFSVYDCRTNQEYSYFNVGDLKEWFDRMGILNRPHYHKVFQEVREWYKKLKPKWDEKLKQRMQKN